MKHIFISYEHQSIDFVRVLCIELEKMGYGVWWDEEIPPGQEWRKEIDEAIRAAFAMIVVMTPEARHSEYVTYEWSSAFGMGKPVIPVLYKHTEFHPRFEVHQFLNFTDTRLRPWTDLKKRLEYIESYGEVAITGNINSAAAQTTSDIQDSLFEVLADLYYSGLVDLRTLNIFVTRKIITRADFSRIRNVAENRPLQYSEPLRG